MFLHFAYWYSRYLPSTHFFKPRNTELIKPKVKFEVDSNFAKTINRGIKMLLNLNFL